MINDIPRIASEDQQQQQPQQCVRQSAAIIPIRRLLHRATTTVQSQQQQQQLALQDLNGTEIVCIWNNGIVCMMGEDMVSHGPVVAERIRQVLAKNNQTSVSVLVCCVSVVTRHQQSMYIIRNCLDPVVEINLYSLSIISYSLTLLLHGVAVIYLWEGT